jgi:NAD(P)-dependent dehydrogenase (short-subunit alcohol dehydrogenase family)
MKLEAQVAIVTGGGRGIGRAIAKTFAAEGATVIIAELDADHGKATAREIEAAGGQARFIAAQVADRTSVEAMVQATVAEFGRIDILVNNAAILGENGHVLEVSQAVWDRVIGVNQTGVFICSQVVGRVMAAARRGNIINIGSVNSFVPQPRCVAYGAAKAAILGMTVLLAEDLAPYGIRANCIAPGPIQSNLPDDAPPKPSESTLLGRAGLPSEIATVALFLASDESSYVNGQCIKVDGGMLNNGYRIYQLARPEAQSFA